MKVGAIDGVVVRQSWDEPVLVNAGPHTIEMGALFGNRYGSIATPADLAAEKTYVVRGARKGQFIATAWIEDQQTGQPITERLQICLGDPAPIIQLLSPCAK